MIRKGVLVFENTEAGLRAMKQRVAGLTLLERGIRTMARAGLRSITVLCPSGGETMLSPIARKLEAEIAFVTWESAAGDSDSQEGHLLLWGDHVHHHSSLSELLEVGLGPHELIVHAGQPHQGAKLPVRLNQAKTGPGAVKEDGLASTGAFLCAAGVFTPSTIATNACSLETQIGEGIDGVQFELHRSTKDLWRRVVDRSTSCSAKNMLFGQVTKTTSGFISRNINARISIPTSKFLVETGLSPHAVTVLFVLTTGLAAAYCVTMAEDYKMLLLSGVLWQFAAIFDRCDGEIARVRLCESKFGAWFDTVTDNIAYIAAYAGLLIGVQRLYPDNHYYMGLGLSALIALLLYLGLAYRYALKTGSGSLQYYLRDSIQNVPANEKIFIYKIMERYGFIAKRDFLAFFFFVTAATNVIQATYWFLIVGQHLLVVAILVSQRKVHESYQRNRVAKEPDGVPALEAVPLASGSEKAR